MSLNTDGLPVFSPAIATGQEKAAFDTYLTQGQQPQSAAISLAGLCYLATSGQGTALTAVSGAVTVATTKSIITTDKLTLAPGATYTLTVTDSSATVNSRFYITLVDGTNTTELPLFEKNSAAYIVSVTPASGSIVVVIGNAHPTNNLNGTVVLYAVLL